MEIIILAGHGSPKDGANTLEQTAKILHTTIHPSCTGSCVRAAYLQFAQPDIAEAIVNAVKSGADRIIIHPYFLSSGMHVTKDIPGIIDDARRKYPGVEFIFTEPLGVHAKLAQIVLERIQSAGGLSPAEIEAKSFELLSDETDMSGVPADRQPIVKRVIHATADFEFRGSLVFHPEAVRAGIAAIKAGRDILTDVEMVRTGINRKLLQKWGGKVVCEIQQSAVSDQPSGKETRAEKGIEKALRENNNIGIIAVGNAPTALLKAIDVLTGRGVLQYAPTAVPPPLVIGVPVGFVKALESKTLLAGQSFPFITNLSRKGGTPVAVAIVNALLLMAEEQ